jgi:hypothetical protein
MQLQHIHSSFFSRGIDMNKIYGFDNITSLLPFVPVQGRPAARARDASLEDADAIGISDNE